LPGGIWTPPRLQAWCSMAVGTTGDTLLSKVESAPRPFILLPDAHASGACPPGTALNVQLTLIGHSNRQLPYVLHALEQAAKRGLGTQRGRSRLEAVCQQDRQGHWQPIYQPGAPLQPHPVTTPPIPPCPQQVQVAVLTPLRLRHQSRYVSPERFSFGVWFAHLLRRIALLSQMHTDHPLNADFAGLVQHGHTVALHAPALYWQDGQRYSSRQRSHIPLGGLLGHFTLAGDVLAPFWPYVWLSQWTHVGKGTCMGLGGIQLGRWPLPNAGVGDRDCQISDKWSVLKNSAFRAIETERCRPHR
jgi:hypothetical protein